jgi:presenilin-like A22 family membrane protease
MFYAAIGWIGMILFLINYYLVSNKKVDASGIPFNAVQVIAAAAIAISLLPAQAWPVITLEVFFMMIGIKAIYQVSFK